MFDGRFKTQIERYVRPIGESLRRTRPFHRPWIVCCRSLRSCHWRGQNATWPVARHLFRVAGLA